jgi:hypothetical protein
MKGDPLTDAAEVGKHYKVHLPAETPWVECLAVMPDGTWVGRIDNDLVGSASEEKRLEIAKHHWPDATGPLPKTHDYKLDDIVRFGWLELFDGYFGWQPMEWTSS